jgi:predicted ester cyclase
MSESDNIRTADKLWEAINAHQIRTHDEVYTSDFSAEAPGSPGTQNLEQNRGYIEVFLTAFPDLHFEIPHKVAQGDYVVFNWVGSGTHTGPLRTPTGDIIPPTGRKAVVPGSITYQFRGNKVARSWAHWDMVTMLAQLGLMPGM